MWLIVVTLVLILAVALFQVIHGVYSAVIMAILTTVSALVAFGCYEWLGRAFLYENQGAYADAVGLIAIFVLLLLALRLPADRFLQGNVVIGVWADRIGGGLLGLYTGTVMVGVLVVVVQSMPLGTSIMGYRPFDDSLRRAQRLQPFRPDEFVLGLVSACGGLSGSQRFDTLHDDLLLETFCARNTAGKNGRVDAPSDSLTVSEVCEPKPEQWEQVTGHKKLPVNPLLPKDVGVEARTIIVHVSVAPAARDEDNWYRLPATHFRMVTGDGRSYYPVGYLEYRPKEAKWVLHPARGEPDLPRITQLCFDEPFKNKKPGDVYWVYVLAPIPQDDEVDMDVMTGGERDKAAALARREERQKMHQPAYVVFRRIARMEISSFPSPRMPDAPNRKAPADK